ncbi:DUF6069 family protein [Promicromonospora thailandica]|uniref:Uncharacterized protein n=1 Tax=Promicromonospora thailandica TaxID=765201 RepID=A0A9X2JXJ7_9MICO|nr:DUF6069 family protein [Promicromonospora thailandica]MCP2267331.1 hypothetical protein [Promicromonospora thailandica]BFF20809.1 hypothetical protein GCM10025730_43300 [Promicromonospora thailandica]
MSDPNRPYDPDYGEQPPPAYVPAQAPGTPVQPVGQPPGEGYTQPVTSGTENPRLGLEVGRYWAGAAATVLVAALIGLAATFILESVLGLDVHSQLDLSGTGSDLMAWVVAGALFAALASVVLYLFVLSTPRPRSFFGWVVVLATVILATVPFADRADIVPAILAAVIWIIIGSAVYSLLTGTLSRTVVQRT